MPLFDSTGNEPHVTDDTLELYVLKHSLTTDERAKIEEHLFSCRFCISRLEKLQEFIDLLRAAFRLKRRSEPHGVFRKALLA